MAWVNGSDRAFTTGNTDLAWTTVAGNTTIDNSADWYATSTIICDPSMDLRSIEDTIKTKLPEGVELMTLYDIYMVYAENRKKPQVIRSTAVLAESEEDAKIKSGLMKDVKDEWDTDYLTFIVVCLGNVKTKAKPKEVKTV